MVSANQSHASCHDHSGSDSQRTDSSRESPATATVNDNLLLQSVFFQPKLQTSQPDDPHEREADRVAKAVMSTSAISSPPNITPLPNTLLQRRSHSKRKSDSVASSGAGGSGAGQPLPRGTRSYFEQRFGRSFESVRVHSGENAHASASAVNARAYTQGTNIVFAKGQYQPHTYAGRELLAHELTHTVQQRGISGQYVQREGPVFVVTEHAASDVLGRYPRLQTALSPDQWQRLNRAAQHRYDSDEERADSDDDSITSVDVSLRSLLLPPPAESAEEPTESWQVTAFQAGYGSSGTAATLGISQVIQSELVGRWLDLNSGILDEQVTVALVDPSGSAGGLPVLTFQLRNVPVQTEDGGLLIGAVDRALDNQFPSLVADLQTDIESLQFALEKAGRAKAVADAVDRLIATEDADLAGEALTQCVPALTSAKSGLSDIDDIFSGQVSGLSARLQTLIDTGVPDRIREHETWRSTHDPDEPVTVTAERLAEENAALQRDLMRTHPMLAGYAGQGAMGSAMGAGFWNMIFPGESEAYHAYDEGRISLNTYLDLDSEIRERGYIVAGITAAVTVATLGLGIYLAPATLGGEMLLAGTLGAVDSMTPMIASTIYTDSVSFRDPTASAIWGSGSYSAGDIALSGAMGFGLGALFPAAGALISRVGSRASAEALILAAEAGETTALGGATVRVAGAGTLEISVQEESTLIRITREGWEMYGPAGDEANVLLGRGSWGPGAEPGGVLPEGLRGQLTYGGESPFAFHAYDEGWGFLSPNSETPFAMGTWQEMLGPPGVGSPWTPSPGVSLSEGSPFLLPSGEGGTSTGMPLLSSGSSPRLPPGAIELPDGQGIIIRNPTVVTPPPERPFGLLPESGSSGLPDGEWRVADLSAPSLRNVPASSLPYAGDRAWGRSAGNWWLYESTAAEPAASTLHLYQGPAGDQGLVLDIPGQVRSLHTDPSSAAAVGRGYPMEPVDMTDPLTGSRLARSHLDPHARSRRMVLPDGSMGGPSTGDSLNFVGHDQRFNTRVRRTLEGRLSGSRWQSIEVWDTPRSTTGGYPVVTEEIIVQLGADGAPERAWRIPTSEGSQAGSTDIDQLLGPRSGVGYSGGDYEIPVADVPPTLRGRE